MHRQYSLYGSFQNLSSTLDMSNNDSPNLSLGRHYNTSTQNEEITYFATQTNSNPTYHPPVYQISGVANNEANLYGLESPRIIGRTKNEYDVPIKTSIPRFLMSPQRESPQRSVETKSPLRLNLSMLQ